MGFCFFDFWVSECLVLRFFEIWTSTGVGFNDSFGFRLWEIIVFWVLGVRVLRFVYLSFSLALMSDFDLDIFLFGYGHWCLVHPCSQFCYLSWFLWCKEHPWPLSPDLGLWRTQKVTDWGLATWSWFSFGHWSLIKHVPNFGSLS